MEDIDATIKYFQRQYDFEDRPYLNDDIMYEILLNANADELIYLCYLNKTTEKICHTVDFWNIKAPTIKYQNLSLMLKEYIKLENIKKEVMQLINSITYFFNKDYQGDLSYHKEAVYKMVLIRLVIEVNIMIANKLKRNKKKLSFEKYMYGMKFFIDEEEPLTQVTLSDLKKEVIDTLTTLFYESNNRVNFNNVKEIYRVITSYMSQNFNTQY